jgi:PAS domain S-box-containing protein
MKNNPATSPFPRKYFVIFAIVAAGFVVLGTLYYQELRESIKKEKQRELSTIADLKVQQIVCWRSERYADALLSSQDEIVASRVKRWFQHPVVSQDRTDILNWLASIANHGQYRKVYLIDKSGTIRLSVGRGPEQVGAHVHSTAKEALRTRKIIFGDFEREGEEFGVHLDLFAPMYLTRKRDTASVAVILLQVDPQDSFFQLVQFWPIPSRTSEAVLVRREADSITFLTETKDHKHRPLSLRLPMTQNTLPSAKALKGEEGIVEGVDYAGVPVLAATRRIPDSPWSIVVKVSLEEMYAPLQERKLTSEFFVGVLIVAAGSIIGLVWRHLRRKLAEETQSASDARYRRLFEAARDGILILDAETGMVVDVNPFLVEMLGYSREQFLGKRIWELGFFKDIAANKSNFSELQQKEFIQYENLPLETATGRLINVEFVSHVYQVDHNKVIQCNIRDITERKRAEEELKRSEEQYRKFFEDDLTGDFLSTPDGKIISCNPAFARIFGFVSVQEALKFDANALFPESEGREKFLSALREGKKLEYYESEYLRCDGSPVYCIENAFGIFDTTGNLVQMKRYIFDDSKRKSLERQLIQAQKLESLGTLASGIAHDFNNILGIIIGYASLLTQQISDPEKIRTSAEAVVKASMRGAALAKQLLTFARKTDTNLTSVSLNGIVTDASKLLSETIAKTIEITLDLEKGLPVISADATQIHQVMINLCVNARDAMPNGGTLTVTTHLQQGDAIRNKFPNAAARQYISLSVADMGIGMDERTRNRIFEPFFTTKEIGKGTGLGLSVVFGIMESHKGFVNVESEPGKGTTFHLFFPLPQSVEIEQVKAETQKEIPGGTETLLIVEDEEMLRELLKNFLRSAGYRVFTAVDGQEAVDLFEEHCEDIQLVLSDMGLPKLSGIDVFRKMKLKKPNVRFILASGFMESQMKTETSKEGLKDFLEKPYSVYEVLQAVRTILDSENR